MRLEPQKQHSLLAMAPGLQTLCDVMRGMPEQPLTTTTSKGRAMEITQELRTLAKYTAGPLAVSTTPQARGAKAAAV